MPVKAGDLLRQRSVENDAELLIPVAADTPSIHDLSIPDSSVWVTGAGAVLQADEVGPGSPPGASVMERLTFELRVRGGASLWRLDGLGFVPGHPRYWRDLPTDALLFSTDKTSWSELSRAAANPRFPIGGPPAKLTFTIPLGMNPLPVDFSPAIISDRPPLERDGLREYRSELFLDEKLVEPRLEHLMDEADFVRYFTVSEDGTRGRTLQGIHATLSIPSVSIDEPTLIAVPDASHTGWEPATHLPPAPPLPSEPLVTPSGEAFNECGLRQLDTPVLSTAEPGALSWTAADDAVSVLEESIDPDPKRGQEILRDVQRSLTISGRQPGHYYYRVRQVIGNVTSDWSNTVVVTVTPESGYVAIEPDRYSPNVLLDVHRALLRMCAGRGDLFAVLSLPRHYGENESLVYGSWLKATEGTAGVPTGVVPMLGFGELPALSYAALYHPWIVTAESPGETALAVTPPDGAMAGVIAKRSRLRGAWIAPANERLEGILALEPELHENRRIDLQQALINQIHREPHAHVALNANTLSLDEDLQPIGVRRLLHLLRRLALREGATLVFEPNDATFRRLVQRHFERMLRDMFVKGAFRGAQPDQAFRVVADETLNTPRQAEQGRFFVDLKVAPSLPMRFLTIRLQQTGDRLSVSEVA